MKRYLLFGAVLFAATSMVAQPVIDLVDAPQVDEHYHYVDGTYTPITISGPDAIWDLSGVGASTETDLPCESPDATAFGSLYPTATLALDGGGSISYLRADATGLYTVGLYKEIGQTSIQIQYTDESLMLPYPCTYNTAYADSFAYNYSFTGPGGLQTVLGGGSSNYVADGFGTLVLPYDTIHNVLKVSGIDTSYESIPGTSYLTVAEQVYFYKPGIHYFVLKATYVTQYVNGGAGQSGSGLSYMSQAMFAGIHEDAANAIGIEAWPVPARNVLNVSYGLSGGCQVDVALFDVTGRNVRSISQRTGTAGIQVATLNVEDLPAGIYMLTVTDDHGQRGTRQVVIE